MFRRGGPVGICCGVALAGAAVVAGVVAVSIVVSRAVASSEMVSRCISDVGTGLGSKLALGS